MMARGGCAVVLSGWLMASAAVWGAQASQTSEKPHTVTLPAGKLDEYVGQYREAEEP